MVAGTFPQLWEEVAIVSIMKKGGTKYEFNALSETIDIAEGDYPGESIGVVSGGGIWKQMRQEDSEITLELYPVSLGTAANNTGLFQHFNGGTWDTSEPMSNDITYPMAGIFYPRDRFLVAIMWTNDITQDSAIDIDATGTSTKVALRFYAKECRIVSHKSSFTDGLLKTTVTFKYPAISKAGAAKNYAWESSNDMLTSGDAELQDLTYA